MVPEVGAPVLFPGAMSVPATVMLSVALSTPVVTEGVMVVVSVGCSVCTAKTSAFGALVSPAAKVVVPGKVLPDTTSAQL
jgi:magnesium-transporting ATPase (P-type)